MYGKGYGSLDLKPNRIFRVFLKGAVHPPNIKLYPIFDQALLMDWENAELRVIGDD